MNFWMNTLPLSNRFYCFSLEFASIAVGKIRANW